MIFSRVELEAVRPQPDPVVLRGITLSPKHGTPVRVARVQSRTPPARDGVPRVDAGEAETIGLAASG